MKSECPNVTSEVHIKPNAELTRPSLGIGPIILDNIPAEQKPWKSKLFIATLIFLVPVIVAVKVNSTFPDLWTNGFRLASKGERMGPVSQHILQVFEQYDDNRDVYLNPSEFQQAFYDIKANRINDRVNLTDAETEQLDVNLRDHILSWQFDPDETVMQIRTHFTPIDVKSMRKVQNDHDDKEMTGETWTHLSNLFNFTKPNIDQATFAAADLLSIFSTDTTQQRVGSIWDMLPRELAGPNSDESPENQVKHLTNYRYLPPAPMNHVETILMHLLSMFHPRPFIHMRFPPRGLVLMVRAESEHLYEVMFRFHPEFQLNEQPQYPFWYTPASFIGRVIMSKDNSTVHYFKMYLPNHIKLNIDMEWVTPPEDQPQEEPKEGQEPKTVHDAYGQEVDIAYCDEMKLESTGPSAPSASKAGHFDVNDVKWTTEIDLEKAYRMLEKEFFPFKAVPYVKFNETFPQASTEGKLIHHILMWGALEDQSC